jgi:hypothetical protein
MRAKVAIRLVSWAAVLGMSSLYLPASCGAVTTVRFADVVTLTGDQLKPLAGYPIGRLGVLACTAEACRPIPMQVDERDQFGAWVLDSGPWPSSDSPAGVFDGDDVLLFMAADSGEAAARARLPSAATVLSVELIDPLSPNSQWVYVVGYDEPAPRAPHRYVDYDPGGDRFTGARVQLGFRDGVPNHIAVDGGSRNLLDRLKIRAAASLFWGWLRFERSEDDLSNELIGWHAGPIRVIRHQQQRVRLGWGIRSPTFRSYTYFHRDFAELPVGLRLNHRPTYFFSDIVIEVILDFRDLVGWQLYLPRRQERLNVGEIAARRISELNLLDDTTFALIGAQVTLVQTFSVSSSLQTVYKHLIYRDGLDPDPPESVAGQRPGVGYGLERWEDVNAGEHGLLVVSYALPPGVDVDEFVRSRTAPLQTAVKPMPSE